VVVEVKDHYKLQLPVTVVAAAAEQKVQLPEAVAQLDRVAQVEPVRVILIHMGAVVAEQVALEETLKHHMMLVAVVAMVE